MDEHGSVWWRGARGNFRRVVWRKIPCLIVSAATLSSSAPPILSGHWIEHWEPENQSFWASTGRRIANRNLWFSIFVEHVGFSVWSL